MNPPIRVGIIGYGYATKTFHAPLIACVPGLAITAIASSDAAKVHADWPQVEVVPTPQALIGRSDIDLVIVPTPNDTHHPLARAALLAGKHVVVDKPFTLTRAEAEDLCRLAAQHRRVLSVFHNRRWDGDFLTVRELLARGELGRITYVESHFDRFRPQVRTRWREQDGPGSGLWMDLGPHLVDQALQLFGRPDALALDLMTQRDGAQANDGFHARLRYANGLRVVLHASVLAAAPGARFRIHGTGGSLLKHGGLDPQEDALKAGQRPDGRSPWNPPAETATLHRPDPQAPDLVRTTTIPVRPGCYRAYYEALCDAIAGRGANPVPPEDAVQVMALLDLGVASHAERRELPVTA